MVVQDSRDITAEKVEVDNNVEGRLNAPNMVKEQEGDEEGAGGSPEEAELELDRWDSVTKLTLWCHTLKLVLLYFSSQKFCSICLEKTQISVYMYDNDGIWHTRS